ncbi:unnamed protein product [Blumeria hordei]|uniref:Uncharacterized protein n=1 Tax=Blumeria hordei TaxID=2867405 RepID=A0A383USJ6_BLUHO|nr:unnamed protein product [Blumeria hordei]
MKFSTSNSSHVNGRYSRNYQNARLCWLYDFIIWSIFCLTCMVYLNRNSYSIFYLRDTEIDSGRLKINVGRFARLINLLLWGLETWHLQLP